MAGKEEVSPLVAQIVGAVVILLGGVVTSVTGFKVGKRNNTTSQSAEELKAKTTLIVTEIDAGVTERADLRHDGIALRLEIANFRAELDKSKSDFLDYKEKLGLANVEIEKLRGQVGAMADEIVRRKQEYEATITKLHDENITLRAAVANVTAKNQKLEAQLNELTTQVHGNSRIIHEIGGIEVEVKNATGESTATTSLQALSQDTKDKEGHAK